MGCAAFVFEQPELSEHVLICIENLFQGLDFDGFSRVSEIVSPIRFKYKFGNCISALYSKRIEKVSLACLLDFFPSGQLGTL